MQVKYRNFASYRLLSFHLKFFVFISLSYDSMTLSHIIAESSIILAKYFPFSQLHVEGLQI